MSLSRLKGNCFKGDQTGREAATSSREGSTPPRQHLTPPPHPSVHPSLHPSSRRPPQPPPPLTDPACPMPLPSLPPAPSTYFPTTPRLVLLCPPPSPLSFKAPLGSLFRNYNRSGFRQFDQMRCLHVRIGKVRRGWLGLRGEPWGGLEWNYQFNGWGGARRRQTMDIKWGLSDFRWEWKVPHQASSRRGLTPPSLLWRQSKPKYMCVCVFFSGQTHSLFWWENGEICGGQCNISISFIFIVWFLHGSEWAVEKRRKSSRRLVTFDHFCKKY